MERGICERFEKIVTAFYKRMNNNREAHNLEVAVNFTKKALEAAIKVQTYANEREEYLKPEADVWSLGYRTIGERINYHNFRGKDLLKKIRTIYDIVMKYPEVNLENIEQIEQILGDQNNCLDNII